jgi:hypothetical protein
MPSANQDREPDYEGGCTDEKGSPRGCRAPRPLGAAFGRRDNVLVADELNREDARVPWPAEDDDPYQLTPDAMRLIACLNFTHDEPWYGIAEGFKRIADLAVAHVEQTGHDQDFLVYPTLFSYRHYLEVMLKQLIRDAHALLDRDEGVPRTHNLEALWDRAEPLLARLQDSPDTYRNVRASLARFNEFDPGSDSYRYPVDTKGEPHLPGVYNIDLGQVRAVVERLSGFLDGASSALDAELDVKGEMAQWYDQ